MGFFSINTGTVVQVVFSDDPDVMLALIPQTDAERGRGDAPARESREPLRLLRVDKVELVGPGSVVMGISMISSTKQMQCSGGIAHLDLSGLCRAHFAASGLGLKTVSGPGVDARDPKAVAAWLEDLPLKRREALGEPIFNESAGLSDPFVFRA